MSLPIRFRDDALGEFDAAASWYEERLTSLGVEFVAEVQRVLNSIGLLQAELLILPPLIR